MRTAENKIKRELLSSLLNKLLDMRYVHVSCNYNYYDMDDREFKALPDRLEKIQKDLIQLDMMLSLNKALIKMKNLKEAACINDDILNNAINSAGAIIKKSYWWKI